MRFTSYVDYITSYIIGDDIDQVALTLEDLAVNLFKRFPGSKMKPNPEKWHLLIYKVFRRKKNIDNHIRNSKCKILLEIEFDSKPNFEADVGDLR